MVIRLSFIDSMQTQLYCIQSEQCLKYFNVVVNRLIDVKILGVK